MKPSRTAFNVTRLSKHGEDSSITCYVCISSKLYFTLPTSDLLSTEIELNKFRYRPYRCPRCLKDCFYTEEEGRFHMSTHHPNDEVVLMKEFNQSKESAARIAFKHIFLMCRDGPEVTKQRVFDWELEAAQQVMKFQYLRFKRPIVLTKKPYVSDHFQLAATFFFQSVFRERDPNRAYKCSRHAPTYGQSIRSHLPEHSDGLSFL